MPVDPNIPLQAGQNIPQFGPNLPEAINNQLGAAKLALFNQQQAGQNALRMLYSDPANLDGAGNLKPEAMRSVAMVDPNTAIGLRQQLTQDQTAQAQLGIARAREGQAVVAEKMRVASEAMSEYQDALKTMTPEQARRVAQTAWTAGRDELTKSGLASPEAISTMPSDFEPNRVGRTLNAWNQAMLTPEQRLQATKLPGELEKTRADIVKIGAETQKAESDQFDKPQNIQYTDAAGKSQTGVAIYDRVARNWLIDGKVVNPTRVLSEAGSNNPTAEAFSAFMQAHPDATPEQQAQFIQNTRAPPRSAPAMALRKFTEENPTATADQVTGFAAKYGQVVSAERNFGTGQQGNQVRSLNVVADHLDTLTSLGDALKNGDVRTLSRLRNIVKTEFGYDQVVDFDLAKKIVGDEVVKSVIGSGAGGVTDRAALQADFDAARSPDQLNGVIRTAKRLIAGQYEGLQRQYNSATFGSKNSDYGISDFDSMLSPGAKKMLGEGGKGSASTEAASNSAAIPPPPQSAGPIPTYSTLEQFETHPPTGYWRKPDDPPGMVRPP